MTKKRDITADIWLMSMSWSRPRPPTTTPNARPGAREMKAPRVAIAQPAPIGVNTNRTPVAAG